MGRRDLHLKGGVSRLRHIDMHSLSNSALFAVHHALRLELTPLASARLRYPEISSLGFYINWWVQRPDFLCIALLLSHCMLMTYPLRKMKFSILLVVHILATYVHCDASDYLEQAVKLMEESPLLDTHIDLPQIIRSLSKSLVFLRG